MIEPQRSPAAVLHIVDPGDPSTGSATLALVVDAVRTYFPDRPARHVVLVIGNRDDVSRLRALGLKSAERLAAPSESVWRALPGVRHFIRAKGPFDIIHAWSRRALGVATLAAVSTPRLLTLAHEPPSPSMARWLNAQLTTRATPASQPARTVPLAISNTVKRAWVEAGSVEPDRVHVLRPGLDFSRLATANRTEIRKRWGVVSDDITIIAAPGEPDAAVDAWRVAHHVAHARLAGHRVAAAVPPGARAIERSEKLLESCGGAGALIVDEVMRDPWTALPACDLVFVLDTEPKAVADRTTFSHDPRSNETDQGSPRALARRAFRRIRDMRWMQRATVAPANGTLPMLWAAAAGRVIVSEATYAVSEILEHGHSALLAKPGDAHGLSRRMLQALEDTRLAWTLRDSARSEAFSFFSRSRYASDLATVYSQILDGGDIVVPDLPVTGGLRFSGRA